MTAAPAGVYRPQQDSQLLIDAVTAGGPLRGRRVADLGTGSGVVAIAAAGLGGTVTAFDVCPNAVRCARAQVAAADAAVDVRLGSWTRALEFAPFDLVLSNPPYVPVLTDPDDAEIPASAGPPVSWDGGADGRRMLDPLCAAAPDLLSDGGTLFVVQSSLAGAEESLRRLVNAGLRAEIIATKSIPFGPVLSSQARALESAGRLALGRRSERLVVIRADKP
ncbi:HemK2/MTQ2 family protein methyltransferase [Mycolicibacterium fallax]|uniref:Methylase n=1 Tax=Mycolicibacterium fallax TaxID=1793 RepID=A0A1X1R9D8_MYCFA|nr:HemK2/MTQ2 family protein methyltransferase [Mycolicibacterium fallax]ORV01774.1 methylase [Mycolicibacterium fallax]BBY98075.1 methylase [Mycolicibacterium fallax]HOW94801.1 methyltransferase [Mycolicibacterium fallax]HSA41340.1 methyltransferase [Mycobacterium sp.]